MICLMADTSAHFDDPTLGRNLPDVMKQGENNMKLRNHWRNCMDHLIKNNIAFFLVSEFIRSDWRNLARQLGITEYDIVRIDSQAYDQHTAASEVTNFICPKLFYSRSKITKGFV